MKQQKLIALGALAAVLVVAVVWYMALWKPEGASLKTAQASLQQAQGQVATDQAQLAQLKAQVPKVKGERAVLKKLVQAVPNGPSLDQALTTLRAAARRAGVTLQSVSVPEPTGWGTPASSPAGTPASPSGPLSLGLSVAATGSQAQLLAFVRAVDAQPRLYVVNSFALSSVGNTGTGHESTTFSINTFYASSSATSPVFPG